MTVIVIQSFCGYKLDLKFKSCKANNHINILSYLIAEIWTVSVNINKYCVGISRYLAVLHVFLQMNILLTNSSMKKIPIKTYVTKRSKRSLRLTAVRHQTRSNIADIIHLLSFGTFFRCFCPR